MSPKVPLNRNRSQEKRTREQAEGYYRGSTGQKELNGIDSPATTFALSWPAADPRFFHISIKSAFKYD